MVLVAGLAGCAQAKGNVRDNINLYSGIPEPSRPLEPSKPLEPARPLSFPKVTLISERSSGSTEDTLLASLTPGRPRTAQDSGPGAPQPPKPGEIVSMGVVKLPVLPEGASEVQKTFYEQATRAVIRVVERDFDDPSICQGLREQLISRPELASSRSEWEQLLVDAIARAKALQQLSPVLRLVRHAYGNAKRDPKGFYRDIDQASCRQAFVLLFDVNVDAVEVEVTVNPLERMKLRDIEALCRDSHDAVLSERVFPNSSGTPPLRKMVRRMFMNTYPDANVKRVVIKDGWREVDGGRRRVLRAVLGVQRENAFPNDPCTMEVVTLSQTKSRGRFESTECCDIQSAVAITCDQIEPDK
ncbi:MAG TPA: hypothetical protein VLC93_08135 [Myxococcota bacterium]|nr:hypothetical protein [Myxococcota bacterium]